jgi:hypothetical protein
VVEGGGLENRITRNRDGGSNPSPSATSFRISSLLVPLYFFLLIVYEYVSCAYHTPNDENDD